MTDEERLVADSDLSPRRWRMFALRRRFSRMGSVSPSTSKRSSRSSSDGTDRQDGLIVQLQSSVLIQLGLALRAYREGATLSAILHLSRAAEAISAQIETMSDGKVELLPEEVV
jgi:hypothetical protein